MASREAKTLPKLQSAWVAARNSPSGWPQFLEAVYVDGLRGWKQQWVEFRFPVVAIAGENGSGKSTILKAAATAYGQAASGKDYTPDDFFPSTPWEDVEGVRLAYRVRRGSDVATHTVRKPTSRWRGMPERPSREVLFLDVSRTQPIDSLIGYGKVARTELAKSKDRLVLEDGYRLSLSRVMGRTYTEGSIVRDARGKQVGVVKHDGSVYSNFHQGTGEDTTTDLMAALQIAPRHSLVLIDEVEASLHPRAQRRLMTELIDIATQRRLQLIVTTHSPYVLEQLPAEARIYLRMARGGGREPIYGVTADYALSLMDDEAHPELTLYCEDGTASQMTEQIIRSEDPVLLERVQIAPVGPAGTVRILGDLAGGDRLPEGGVGVLDGDQPPARGCIVLPGKPAAPERAIFESLNDDHYVTIAQRLGVDAGTLMDATEDAMRLEDHHAWPARVAKKLGTMRTSRVLDAFLDVWVRDVLTHEEREVFVEHVRERLPAMEAPRTAE